MRLARQLAVVERPYTHGHFHGGHTSFSMICRLTVQTRAIMQGSSWSVPRYIKDHSSTHQTTLQQKICLSESHLLPLHYNGYSTASSRHWRACAVCTCYSLFISLPTFHPKLLFELFYYVLPIGTFKLWNYM